MTQHEPLTVREFELRFRALTRSALDSSENASCVECARTDCEDCSQSSYLVRCVSLTSCQYCSGCVGLSGKDFHVRSEPYDRKAYFALTARLARELAW